MGVQVRSTALNSVCAFPPRAVTSSRWLWLGGVDEYDVVGLTDTQALDVIDTAAKLELQVLQDAARRTQRGAEPLAAESIERLHFEMLREAVLGLIKQKTGNSPPPAHRPGCRGPRSPHADRRCGG